MESAFAITREACLRVNIVKSVSVNIGDSVLLLRILRVVGAAGVPRIKSGPPHCATNAMPKNIPPKHVAAIVYL